MPRGSAALDISAPSARPVLRSPLLFALLFSAIFILHAPLLRLPYFWDEAGYFVPAARDLLLTGSPIPHSTVSNAHPPLVMAWLAAWWKLSGYTPAVARTAMLMVAAFGLLGLFRLASDVAGRTVAVATVICTALYPVFFTQSSMTHLDLAAAALTFWGLGHYFRRRLLPAVIFFSLAALAKETALLTPLALFVWEFLCVWIARWRDNRRFCFRAANWSSLVLFVPILPLAAWFGYHFHRTGYLLGNPEFFRYNVAATLSPLRILVALGTRLWQLLGYMNLFVLTLAAAAALTMPPVRDMVSARRKARGGSDAGSERRPISLPIQLVFAAVIAAHVVALSVIGGAVLARYLLPVTPLVILICVSTLRRRLPWWPWAVAVVCAGFVAALFVNPPWRFAPEDNLAYRDYVLLHKEVDSFVAQKFPTKIVLTAWPASDELTRPWLRYVDHGVRVLRIDDFTLEQVLNARQHRDEFDIALVFSTKYEPRANLSALLPAWERLLTRYFGYHRDLPPDAIARLLDARIIYQHRRGGQWIAVLDLEHVQNAALDFGR